MDALYPYPHPRRVEEARRSFFAGQPPPRGLLSELVLRSWSRCRDQGLAADLGREARADTPALRAARERNALLVEHAEGIMEHVFESIRATGSIVVLADTGGMLLHCLGDPEFVRRAERVALAPGALWGEGARGTNAIGTALHEGRPVEILGGEHFLDRNAFLGCSCAPVSDARGQVLGALNISGDYRRHQQHTLGLVRLAAQMLERRLFAAEFADTLQLAFHPRPGNIGSALEGVLALSPEGRVLGATPLACALLGMEHERVLEQTFSRLFEIPLGVLDERGRAGGLTALHLHGGARVYACLLRPPGRPLPASGGAERAEACVPAGRTARSGLAVGLAALDTGDPQLHHALQRAGRVVDKDIPLLVQGESGVGKEVFAQAFHRSGPRAGAPFVALNCAAIPESLIEAELFGYSAGAFTGARREGAVGKVQQAHGGTLFLDEIGDMPAALQARLLRVLQEKSFIPLGAARAVNVDFALVCATHRDLAAEVAAGRFREDLYYRVNGLTVRLPPLRARQDLARLVAALLAREAPGRTLTVAPAVQAVFARHPWPGNLRQLHNALRLGVALLEPGERCIELHHLPEELLAAAEPGDTAPQAACLRDIQQAAVQQVLDACAGNVSEAARRLGISRNTLYRKLGRGA